VACSTEGPSDLVRSTVVVVPTRGAAHHLHRTYAASGSGRTVEGADAPALLTRDELYGLFNARLAAPLGFLTAHEREVILHTAAVQAVG
jgi:hypothetical protein